MSRFAILAVLLLLLVAACGGDDEDSDASDSAASDDAVAAEVSDDSSDQAVEEEDEEDATEPEETEVPETEDASEESADEEEADEADEDEVAEEVDEESEESAEEEEAESAGELPEGTVEVANLVIGENASGAVEVMGELHNIGDAHTVARDIEITIFDVDGAEIETSWAFIFVNLIPTGEFVPFKSTFWEVDPADVADAEVVADTVVPTEELLADWELYYDFDVLSVEWSPGDASHSVVGDIQNTGDESVELIEIYTVGYASDGSIMFVESTFTDVEVLGPGESTGYSVDWISLDMDEPAELRAWVDGYIVLE